MKIPVVVNERENKRRLEKAGNKDEGITKALLFPQEITEPLLQGP